MSVVIPLDPDAHAAVQALLPWYARGQLADDEAQAVQQHLLQCQACRHELVAEQPLQTLLHAAGAAPPAGDVEAGLARLHGRMAQSRRPAAAPRGWMPLALGAQGVALAVLLGLGLQGREPVAPYVGLSSPGEPAVAADALVMFKPGTTEQAVRALLQAQHAHVVGGPTETGAWLLSVEPAGLAAMRASPLVDLAEPLQPGPAR